MEKLILASCSPRRSELLTLAGIPFETVSPDVDEACILPASEAVAVLSARKAQAVGGMYSGRYVLAADTLVALDGVSLGKPADGKAAERMLRTLSGRTHQVYTGVSLLDPSGKLYTETDRSDVTFCDLTEEEIHAYVRSGEPMDKAGAYALQGRASLWITRLEGSYSSVIGLPLYLVRKLLMKCGYELVPSL
jgi:septum formation protein